MAIASNPIDGTWSVSRLMQWTREYLQARCIPEARLAAEILLAQALGCRRIDLYTRFDCVPEPDVLALYRDLVRRAAGHEPIAYLVEKKEFFSLEFKVTPAVLIPRPETETLVEWAVDRCKALELNAPRVLDVGTGTGCIAIALLKNVPGATAVMADVSSAALAIAKENAARHGVAERAHLVEADMAEMPPSIVPADGFDLILSNPPYVAGEAFQQLPQTVRVFEPRAALTDDADGLTHYRTLAGRFRTLLSASGAMGLEIGVDCAEPVTAVFQGAGGWRLGGVVRDRVAGYNRVVWFTQA